jgi:hypothetical protein
MNNIASNRVRGLYDHYDGRELVWDESTWNDDYMNKLMVQVVGNFSSERLTHLKEVICKLHPITVRPQTQTSASCSSNSQSISDTIEL